MAKLSFPFLVGNLERIPSGCPQGNLYRGHRLKIHPIDDGFPYDMKTIDKDIEASVHLVKEQRGDE